jgi:hypothetical protein
LSRAIGPGLARFGTAGAISDTRLSIRDRDGTELFRNASWQSAANAAELPGHFKAVGAFPLAAGSRDSALVSEIPAGTCTFVVTSPTETEGVGLAELYELDTNGRTVNLSTRARVRPGEGALIGGFVIQGPAYKQILVRAIGPALAQMGIAETLGDPVLTVYAGQAVVASNDNWSVTSDITALEAATRAVNAFPLPPESTDAAILLTLPPGAYTVEVKGKAAAEGVALLEIYDVP